MAILKLAIFLSSVFHAYANFKSHSYMPESNNTHTGENVVITHKELMKRIEGYPLLLKKFNNGMKPNSQQGGSVFLVTDVFDPERRQPNSTGSIYCPNTINYCYGRIPTKLLIGKNQGIIDPKYLQWLRENRGIGKHIQQKEKELEKHHKEYLQLQQEYFNAEKAHSKWRKIQELNNKVHLLQEKKLNDINAKLTRQNQEQLRAEKEYKEHHKEQEKINKACLQRRSEHDRLEKIYLQWRKEEDKINKAFLEQRKEQENLDKAFLLLRDEQDSLERANVKRREEQDGIDKAYLELRSEWNIK